MDEDVRVGVSGAALAIGVAGCLFFAAGAVLSFVVGLTSFDLRIEERTGPEYFLVMGVVGIIVTIWFVSMVVGAFVHRRAGLIRITDDDVSVQTSRGRRSAGLDRVVGVNSVHEGRSLEIALDDGTTLRPVLRPVGGQWASYLEPVAAGIRSRQEGKG